MSIGVIDCDCCLGENDFAAEISEWPQADEGMRENGMTCPNIAARGSEGTEASVALATERSGRPLATRTPTGGAWGL
jgi:hypothetical protein